MRHHITIEIVHCERCGKEIATTSRSLYGLDTLKAHYCYLCFDCTTPEERYEIINTIGFALSGAEKKEG